MEKARVAQCGRDVARMAEQTLDHAMASEEAFAALMSAIEGRIAVEMMAARRADVPQPACAPGCATCCTVNVATLPIEGAAAAAFLRKRLPQREVRARAAALLEFHDRVRWREDGERIRGRLACPLLDERGRCSIHPVRPLACRGLSSLDPGDCRRAVADPEEHAGAVRMNLLQKALYDEAIAALAEALRARGLDARCRDVSGMTGVFLADPARATAYAAGAAVPLE
jgi:Fe-S-cluster containining protein